MNRKIKIRIRRKEEEEDEEEVVMKNWACQKSGNEKLEATN